jgi:hypothetical protein
MAQEWLAENIKLPLEGSLRYQMEKRNVEEEQVGVLFILFFCMIDFRLRPNCRNRTRRRNRGFSKLSVWQTNSKNSCERTPSGNGGKSLRRYR